ncbi:hypothetical protein HK099_008161 [Clydaea vesicula]|uniref:Vacuolar protein sorting-associated protein 29 n=1 Tax=Clydaea vesicula TaxID=447962 RepID=A0AAD5Y2I4_9FUNG|nr:hypothetical protein HK099_008161 [Clydaea vesicula]
MAISDANIPHRASDLPMEFKILVPGKIHQILLLGNACNRSTLDYLKTITHDVLSVKGEFDEAFYNSSSAPEYRVVMHGQRRIGMIHGHQVIPWGNFNSLNMIAKKLDVDILIYGHTQKFKVKEYEGRIFINPGSVTGSFSSYLMDKDNKEESGGLRIDENEKVNLIVEKGIPSFVLMDIQGLNVVLYIYQLVNGELKVDKKEFSKKLD